MMEHMKAIPADILSAAVETAHLELQLGADIQSALRKALEAALATHERHVTSEIAERAMMMASEIEDPDADLFDDGPAALLWLAQVLQEMLPPDPGAYIPTVDDLIEVILTGTVVMHEPGSGHWSIITADFQEIEFDGKTSKGLQVRLIRRDC